VKTLIKGGTIVGAEATTAADVLIASLFGFCLWH